MALSKDIISIIVVMLISSLIGLIIVKTIDAHLSAISINMPAINLPEQKITVKIDDSSHIPSGTSSVNGAAKVGNIIYNSLDSLKPKQTGGQGISTTPREFNPLRYRSESKSISRPTIVVPLPSADHNSRPALYPSNEQSTVEPPLAIDRIATYYRDPKDMTPAQLIKFQEKAKFTNMTVNDYENWLLTFRNMPEKLVGFHRSNLKVLLRGGHLTPDDMPSRTVIPNSARDQYTNIMNNHVDDNIPQPEFLGYQPSNYENQIGSPSKNNRNLRHLDYINPDEPLKTWILTRQPAPLK
jgi:hypothetical protein